MLKNKELLNRIYHADENAFKQFFESNVSIVYRFINKFIKDKAESEDITQLVFIKIWDKRASILSINSIDAYLFTIAHRLVIDYFRSNASKFKKNTDNPYLNDSFSSTYTAEDSLNKHEFDSIYEKAIQRLSPKRREIYILSRHEGLSNKEIAERLQISVKTVENQMTAALSSLKSFLSQSELGILFIFFTFHIFK
jgi:RNA polymerase sigma-70 factor (ECF subfamily)